MKLFSSFILSLCSVMGFSQTILYQAENTTRTVQDPQTVVLAQGFHATGSVSNPFVAKIGPATENPGGGPTGSQAGANNPSGTTAPSGQSFHDTKGNIEVNASGQLQFSLPIALPPGVKSVAPQLNLVYTSGASNGVAGYGWNISGLTTISRISKTIEKDGETKGAQFDYSDTYSLNGQKLVLKSGSYGQDGATYVTERYSNVKVKSVGSLEGFSVQNIKGPRFWEVTFEDGSQAWYGASDSNAEFSNARTPFEYNIIKWRDIKGNFITYTYSQANNVSRISSIQWGGNDVSNKPHFNKIDFSYIDRGLVEESYSGGYKFVQNKLLTSITVKVNDNQFKKYVVDYLNNGTNYQFVDKITEYNSGNIAANPIKFTYPTSVASEIDYNGVLPYNSDSFDNIKFTGDFNGDSYLDFIMNNGNIKLGAFNDAYQEISTNKTFSSEAKVVNTLLDEEGQVYNGNGIVQYENGKIIGYIFRNNIFVKVFEKQVYDISDCSVFDPSHSCSISAKLNEGDIDGDGISDIILSLDRTDCYLEIIQDPNEGLPPGGSTCYDSHVGDYIVDLKNPNNQLATYTLDTGINESSYTSQNYLDVDGDGKIDIINVSNSAYTVFNFVQTAPDQYLKKIKFTGNLSETKDSEFPVLYGDFNGDGNLDFTIPVTDNQNADNWRFYMGTENGFQSTLKTDFLKFRKPAQVTPLALIDRHFYSISDINKDGKSDIVFIYSRNKVESIGNSGNALWRSIQYEIKSMQANGGTDFIQGFSTTSISYNIGGAEMGIFSPLTNPIKSNNNYYDIFIFFKTRIHKYKTQTSLAELSRVKSIWQGGILTNVNYKELIPEANSSFYTKVKKEYYPYFSFNRVDKSFAVSQLVQEGKKQDFRYRGMTGHMRGKGMIGYNQMARSSWYADNFENTKIWSGVEIDPLNDGLPAKEWSIRTTNENLVFPTDISENNTSLSSFKSTSYKTDKLINDQIVTTIPEVDKPKVVIARVPTSTTAKDFLTNTTITETINYNNAYYLPGEIITNINNGYAISTKKLGYANNPNGIGSDYYIGRVASKIEETSAYSTSDKAVDFYTYENNLLKSRTTIVGTSFDDNVTEEYKYDDFGNITETKLISGYDFKSRTDKTEYDSKGRFVVKKTDNLNLETQIFYNDWGQVTKEIDPIGNILEYEYDGWGKISKVKSNISGTTTYAYEKITSGTKVSEFSPDGNQKVTYTSNSGLVYKISEKSFKQIMFSHTLTRYDVLGRKIQESEPYLLPLVDDLEPMDPIKWNYITYDDTVFPTKITVKSFNGKEVLTSVSGNITTVKEINGNGRTTTKTVDALGNVLSTTDKGGTINFSYNSLGKQTKAQYGENIVTTKYDVFGRKIEFNDPSNGVYKYEYDGLGNVTKIISPKGTKEFTYNGTEQLISKKELSTVDGGVATNKLISFAYDNKGRLISKSGTSKGKAYSSNIVYDPQGRILSSSESSNGKYFIEKGMTYDDKARVISYEKQLFSSGVMTKVQIENIYSDWNGELYQVKDKNSGKILWELKEINAKGQSLKSKLGAAEINNTYDANGFLSNVNHSSAVKPSILQLSYSFDAIKNELKSRTTGGDFNIVETFDYDDNNRLVNWTNPVTGIKPQSNRNIYDVKGRIMENDQVGTMKYENSAKIYQPTGMTLNAAGTQNYNNDLIQSVVYNENNDPVFIDGMKGDVAFQYGLSNMRQRVTYGGNFGNDADGKFTKFYNEDGSFEILKDNVTGKEKHILYIGGTAYESNIIYVKNYDETNGSYKFLHKDYLGSILAISDEAGNKLEQRHFDAWGNFTHLQIGNGAIITDKNTIDNSSLLIDRGYTGHEHFAEVGIIHMNGRLYDPLLRRFLNADENIQEPFNTQNYNKYGYVLNNPLMFNDPSGEIFGLGETLSAFIIAAFIGAASYTAAVWISHQKFTIFGLFSSIVMSTISAGITTVIGAVFSTSTTIAGEALRGLVHAGVQGTLSFMQGGNFFSAAASAFLSSIIAFGYTKSVGSAAYSGVGQIALGMISGGVGSALTGGNFWEGVIIGGMVAGFNHYLHHPKLEPPREVLVEYWDAKYSVERKEWLINKVSEGYVMMNDPGAGNGYQFVNIYGADGKVSSIIQGNDALYRFNMATKGNYTNIYNMKIQAMSTVTLGKGIKYSGTALGTLSKQLLVPTEGGSAPGVFIGEGVSWLGFGIESYGNYKLGNYNKIWQGYLMSKASKVGVKIWKSR